MSPVWLNPAGKVILTSSGAVALATDPPSNQPAEPPDLEVLSDPWSDPDAMVMPYNAHQFREDLSPAKYLLFTAWRGEVTMNIGIVRRTHEAETILGTPVAANTWLLFREEFGDPLGPTTWWGRKPSGIKGGFPGTPDGEYTSFYHDGPGSDPGTLTVAYA